MSTGGPGTGDGGPVPPNQDPPPPTDPLPPVVPPTTNGGGDLIECQLGGPSSKVILDNGLSTGSNAQATRVCMSRSSCLQVVNQYAADRGCSLASGAATTEGSGAKCTGEFPGSKGTCKNARKLSDAEVLELLSVMSGS